MGFSTSAVVAIFAASLIYMAAIYYPGIEMSKKQVLGANKDSNELWNEKLNTKIVITNWSGNNLVVFNNGSMTLNSSKINVILNGVIMSNSSYTVTPGGVWPPRTSINVGVGAGSGRVKIITANGAADYYSVP